MRFAKRLAVLAVLSLLLTLLAACGDATSTPGSAGAATTSATTTAAGTTAAMTTAAGTTAAMTTAASTTTASTTAAMTTAAMTTAAMTTASSTTAAMTSSAAMTTAAGTTAAMTSSAAMTTGAATTAAASTLPTPVSAADLVLPAGAGTEAEKPELTMALVPSRQSDVIQTQADNIANFLSKETGYKIKAVVVKSYAAVGEGMGAKNIDIGWVGPLDYVISAKKFGVYPITGSVRSGQLGYKAFVIARADSGINSLADLKGKTVILGDDISASSNLYPTAALLEAGIKPGTDVTVRKITNQSAIAIGVEEKAGDAGAFYDDARKNKEVTDKYPNIQTDTKIIYTTPVIPADPQIVRKDLNAAQVKKIYAAMIKLSSDTQGKQYIKDLFTIDGLAQVKDSDYDGLRKVIQAANPSLLQS